MTAIPLDILPFFPEFHQSQCTLLPVIIIHAMYRVIHCVKCQKHLYNRWCGWCHKSRVRIRSASSRRSVRRCHMQQRTVQLSVTKISQLTCLNPLVPSVPKNGTPTLTVNREIIQALMGYTTVYIFYIQYVTHYN